jgi:hypothetical protein
MLALATAMQHVCLAKALMLIREYEHQDGRLSREERIQLKVWTTSAVQRDLV